EGLQPLAALGTITGRIDVADPPKESGLHFRISSVVFSLQVGHHVEGVRSGQVGVDDAVTQARVGMLLLNKGVGVNHPVHGAVPDGMGTHWDAVLVEEADHFSINSRVNLRIAAIGRARTCDIWSRGVTQPSVIDPACAGATRAVHVNFDAAGEEAVVTETGG